MPEYIWDLGASTMCSVKVDMKRTPNSSTILMQLGMKALPNLAPYWSSTANVLANFKQHAGTNAGVSQ